MPLPFVAGQSLINIPGDQKSPCALQNGKPFHTLSKGSFSRCHNLGECFFPGFCISPLNRPVLGHKPPICAVQSLTQRFVNPFPPPQAELCH